MTVLGRVFQVSKYDIVVSLPGHMRGKVKNTDLSKSYTKLWEEGTNTSESTGEEFKKLSGLYQKGDYVVCYVTDDHSQESFVSLSMRSKKINANLDPSTLEKGSTMVCMVKSVKDQVCTMETGVKNIKAFLETKDEYCTSHTLLLFYQSPVQC